MPRVALMVVVKMRAASDSARAVTELMTDVASSRAVIADRVELWRLEVAGALVVVNWSVYV